MFGGVQPASSSPRVATVLGIGVLVLVAGLSGVLGLSTLSRRASAHETAIANVPAPLELVSLTHERDGAALTVRGGRAQSASRARGSTT